MAVGKRDFRLARYVGDRLSVNYPKPNTGYWSNYGQHILSKDDMVITVYDFGDSYHMIAPYELVLRGIIGMRTLNKKSIKGFYELSDKFLDFANIGPDDRAN